MNGKRYKLRFLPLFEEDLNGIVDYVAFRLKNPIAAEALVNDVQKAIQDRLSCAEAFEPYHSARDRQYPYYRISVRNYTIFYAGSCTAAATYENKYNNKYRPKRSLV